MNFKFGFVNFYTSTFVIKYIYVKVLSQVKCVKIPVLSESCRLLYSYKTLKIQPYSHLLKNFILFQPSVRNKSYKLLVDKG